MFLTINIIKSNIMNGIDLVNKLIIAGLTEESFIATH